MLRIKASFPSIRELVSQSDNASCRVAPLALLAAPLLPMIHKVWIKKIMRTETQDGKSLLDAHFSTRAKWEESHLKTGKNSATPAQLVDALQSKEGVSNSQSCSLKHDRAKLEMLMQRLSSLAKKIGSKLPRRSDDSCRF